MDFDIPIRFYLFKWNQRTGIPITEMRKVTMFVMIKMTTSIDKPVSSVLSSTLSFWDTSMKCIYTTISLTVPSFISTLENAQGSFPNTSKISERFLLVAVDINEKYVNRVQQFKHSNLQKGALAGVLGPILWTFNKSCTYSADVQLQFFLHILP